MNERGIFNVIGLCLLLVAAIAIAGVHNTESNFSTNMSDLKLERDLKNAADYGLMMAIDAVNDAVNAGQITFTRGGALKAITMPNNASLKVNSNEQPKIFTTKIDSGLRKNVNVEVWAKLGEIPDFEVYNYNEDRGKVWCYEYTPARDGIALISIAKYEDKYYQSSIAYLLYDSSTKSYDDTVYYVKGTNLQTDNAHIIKKNRQE